MFKLPEINFSKAPFLTEVTIQYHYDKHHRTYIEKLNQLVGDLPQKELTQIIQDSSGALYDNAAQAWNHTFYWLGLTPCPSTLDKKSELARAIDDQLGGNSDLKKKFVDSALSLFGSAWTWLALNVQSNKIEVINTSNSITIDFKKYRPLLICDVWEHAYYIEYRNSRSNYLSEFWSAINWNFVADNFQNRDFQKVSKRMT
jgi:superoxide dismutase, Fe-Mn family